MTEISRNDEYRNWAWVHRTAALCNIFTGVFVIIFVIFVVANGNDLKRDATEYIVESNLTTTHIADMVNNIHNILSNVENVTGNAAPISTEARRVVQDGTVGEQARKIVNATINATRSLPTMRRDVFEALLGNATNFLGNLAKLDFSSVSNVLSDAHDPAIQTTIRERVDHALRSFDFATLGASHAFGALGRAMNGKREIDARSETVA